MADTGSRRPSSTLHKIVLDDLRRGGLYRSIRDEVAGLRTYYLEDAQIRKLVSYGPVRKTVVGGYWLLRSLVLRLTPARRVILFVALAIPLLTPDVGFSWDRLTFHVRLWPLSILALLALLMLELRDKLVARDEIEVARDVQLSLLPREHEPFGEWEMWSATIPANDVGGDLVDYVPLDGHRLGIVLADVAGKGMGAALLCAKLQATIRAIAPSTRTLDELGERLNAILLRDGLENRFATLLYLETSSGSPRVRYVNAGHDPAIVARPGGVIERLPASSFPIGALADSSYVEGTVDLGPDDCLVAYSDGITEAGNPAGEEFGETRLLDVLRPRRDAGPRAIGRAVLEAVEVFSKGTSAHDDRSIVVIRRRNRTAAKPTASPS